MTSRKVSVMRRLLQDELEEFFGQYGTVNAVHMHRIDDTQKS